MIDLKLLENLLFLAAIIYLGLKTSYTDIRHGTIKNKHILFALAYAACAYLLLIFIFFLNGVDVRLGYFNDLLVNGVISLVLGLILWNFNGWSAGDAKLFFAYALLMPLGYYSNGYIKYFPSLMLLVNTFVPFFALFFFRAVFLTGINTKKEVIKEIKIKEFFTLFLNIFWMVWVQRLIGLVLKIKLDFLVSMIIIFFLVIIFQKILKERLWMLSLGLAILRIFLDYRYLLTYSSLKEICLFLFVIFVVLYSMKFSSRHFTKSVSILKLKEGMILAERIFRERGRRKYTKGEIININAKQSKKMDLENPDGTLTKKDIARLQSLYKNKQLDFSMISIQQLLPFAPFMFFGVLLTLLSKGNFLILITKFINYFG